MHKHDKLKAQQSPKQAKQLYQCCFKKCGSIVTRLGQHLTRVRKIKDRKLLKEAKSKCARLSNSTCKRKGKQPKSPPKPKRVKLSPKEAKQEKAHKKTDDLSSSDETESTFQSRGNTTDEHCDVDHPYLK